MGSTAIHREKGVIIGTQRIEIEPPSCAAGPLELLFELREAVSGAALGYLWAGSTEPCETTEHIHRVVEEASPWSPTP
ncbi:MAG: hypothetical protein JJ863_21235 [Deltaproteobacteria bacterium]|nr:hypothetical protein [Deltaproteobacteria bacterium]